LQVEGVICAFHRRHVNIHPLYRLVCRVINCMGMTHPANGSGRSFQQRCTPIDRELRLAVQNDKHLFALIVKMLANAALRKDHASM
jgi:hypothetical protein